MTDLSEQNEWENHHTFQHIQLSDADLSGKIFENCTFDKCDFLNCNFKNSQWTKCVLKQCNISNSDIGHSQLDEVHFEACKLLGLQFSTCKKLLFNIRIDKCNVVMCNFSNLKLTGSYFSGSNIADCDFFGADLQKADFSYCILKGSLFENCDLRLADFRNARDYNIDPMRNKVKKAKFSMPEVLSFLAPYGLDIE